MVFYQTRGGASEGSEKNKLLFWKKYFLQWACRIILGPPKHVLHLVWSVPDISTAIRTALKVARTAQIRGDRIPPFNSGFVCYFSLSFLPPSLYGKRPYFSTFFSETLPFKLFIHRSCETTHIAQLLKRIQGGILRNGKSVSLRACVPGAAGR